MSDSLGLCDRVKRYGERRYIFAGLSREDIK
jgi:hypothetical protein